MIRTYHYILTGYWYVIIVCQNILWTCIKFHLRNKISNITLAKANVHNALIKAKSIVSINALNLDVSDLFNDHDGKINHLIDGMLELDLLLRKMRLSVYFIVQRHMVFQDKKNFSSLHCI